MPTASHAVLALLVCPACRGGLEQREEAIACRSCGLVYPVRDGIPVLIVDQAVSSHGTPVRET